MGAYILWSVVGASVLGGVTGTVMAGLACRHRDRPAMSAFGWLMVVAAGWAFLAAAKMLATDLETVYLLEVLIRVTSSCIAPLLLVFVLAYTGANEYRGPVVVGAAFLVPAIYAVLVVTAPEHTLASGPESAQFVTQHEATIGVVADDPASTVESIHTYAVLALGFGLLFRFLLRSRAIYRRQTAIVAVGAMIPVTVDLGMKFVPLTHPSVDLTPASLGVMGLVLGCGLFRYDFLDVAPMASDILVAELPDPVFVLGEDGRILDHNRAAAVLFEAGSLSGRQIDEVAPGLTENVDGNAVYARPGTDRDEITYFDPRVTTIEDQHGIERGRLVVLRDVTGQQRRQDRLEALQAATRQFITANSAERIAELTVTFADRVLDQDAAAVYVHEPETDTLRVTAASDALEGHYSEATEVVDEPDHPLFETYRDGEIAVEDVTDDYPDAPFPHLLLVPIGDHGVLLIGSAERGAFVTEDEQFATILARTTQVALAQVERERELRQSRQSVERRNEQVEFFNGTLRHTLRNALLVIEGRANHLRDHVDNPRERHLDRIVQWCEDLAELSHDIDAINDTVSATEARQLDEIDLASVIRRRLDGLSQEFDDVEIELDIQGDATVRANDLVEKVVDSIVSNAITHNRAADPRVEITVHRIADRVQLRVADNGPGMGDEMKETVFERNVGTSQTSHGFGLYFVSVMMNLYGGTVWIEDNTDENGDCVGAVAVIEFQQGETQHTSRSAENEMS